MLLHYHVVPGLADDIGPRPEATDLRAGQAAPAGCEDHAVEATGGTAAIPAPTLDTVRAA